MRRAPLRLRQIVTMSAVALLVAMAAISAGPRQHPFNVASRAGSQQATIQHPPFGRRWY